MTPDELDDFLMNGVKEDLAKKARRERPLKYITHQNTSRSYIAVARPTITSKIRPTGRTYDNRDGGCSQFLPRPFQSQPCRTPP